MSHTNPYAKFVKDPSQVPDPNRITLQQFEKYNSLEIEKSNLQLRTLRRSAGYIGGVLGLCLVAAWWGEKQARNDLFGCDNKGGRYLDLVTVRDEEHYAYNRQFQRMFHLAEGQVKDAPVHSDQYLRDLGVDLPVHGAPNVPKKSSHEKYF